MLDEKHETKMTESTAMMKERHEIQDGPKKQCRFMQNYLKELLAEA